MDPAENCRVRSKIEINQSISRMVNSIKDQIQKQVKRQKEITVVLYKPNYYTSKRELKLGGKTPYFAIAEVKKTLGIAWLERQIQLAIFYFNLRKEPVEIKFKIEPEGKKYEEIILAGISEFEEETGITCQELQNVISFPRH